MRAHMFKQIGRDALVALGRELAAWKPTPERALYGVEAVISVVLSVALAHLLHLPNTWWAAISGFAVMQTRFSASAQRGLHRVLGTIVGGLLGALVGPMIGDRPWLFVPVLGAISAVCVYRANGSSASYAWVLGGITWVMVTYQAHELLTFRPTASFAMLRVAEVCVGTFACVGVSGVFHVGMRWYERRHPASKVAAAAVASANAPRPTFETLRHARMVLAVQAGAAVAILAALTYALKLPGFAQALVTTIAVLILPPTSIVVRSQKPVADKMVQRVVGCLIAGAIGIALLPLMQGQVLPCLLALAAGVWAGCHVQTGKQGASYIGVQFTVAFIMVFVQDHAWSADPHPAMMRLAGILTGIAILTCVMLLAARLSFLPISEEATP
ncbi:FUSC family protein [Paraburkholderia azotifigens]|uniref:FUSC family protein n=1 Tax=Paraburkholderia azotifigens TaxID=2057004 RepID=A0A5C6VBE3_9BURK|nr:FUSC family protein [Paraburkholderia azotifigens]TXC82653.1 FUSC family protein [Paraburkholderia azotifigens]